MTYPLKSAAARRRMAAMPPERRFAIASQASRARWYGSEETPACPRCGSRVTNRAGRECGRHWRAFEERDRA